MRLDVTSAKMRKRLVAELSARPTQAHEAAPQHAQPATVHEATRLVKWAQAALSVLLGLRLPLDGALGGTTQAAILRFQAQSGLPRTGALDESTVLAIAKAIGHPPPGMTAEHRLMPRWFELARPAPRPQMPAKPPQSPDKLAAQPPAELAAPIEAPQPAAPQPEPAPHKKLRPEDLP